ncbi:hypothetical protein BN2476_270031 [Paraburkholderia piptadeniae]|uniref:Uncharacterized protein n=1 Tax=Paraburkholderia piptadeniae TaxID=1701573 RepID=A0A1N7S1G7_9BURK|nr:hypothetical protein BN2476_270031 [Paraburkholderia piptadeniae]
MIYLAIQPDVPAALLDVPVRHAQAKAATFTLPLGREKRIKRLLHHRRRHAGAGVGHGHHHVLAGRHVLQTVCIVIVEHRVGRFERQLAALRHRVPCIDGQVQNDVLQLVRVQHRIPEPTRNDSLDENVLAQCPSQQIIHTSEHVANIDNIRRERLATPERQKMRGKFRSLFDRLHRLVKPFARPRIHAVSDRQQLEIAAQHLQHVVEIMGDPTRQLAEGLHLLRLKQFPAGLLKQRGGFALVGNVARYFREPYDLPIFITNGINDDMRPETAAILADPPPFCLKVPFAAR